MARDQLFERIAPALKTTADQLEIGVGRIAVKGTSTAAAWRGATPASCSARSRSRSTASGSAGSRRAARPACSSPTSRSTSRPASRACKKIVCVQDCGLIVDLKTAETQCYGGIISGVNYAVIEERILDRNTANMVNPNMEFYLIAGQSDIPEIDVVLVDQPERGVIGIGEPPAVATAAAIANAVRNATGVTHPQHSDHAGQAAHASSSEREARIEGLRLRQRREREGSGRGALDRARPLPADGRRHGSARPDEGLHRLARARSSTSRISMRRLRRPTAASASARR